MNFNQPRTYLHSVEDYIRRMLALQAGAVRHVGELVAQSIQSDGILHTFGSGHSSLVAAEPTYRAGGLAAVNFLGILPGATGWIAATDFENNAAGARRLIVEGGVRRGDIVVVVSHSGQSALVLAVNRHAIEAGASTVALTASANNPLAAAASLLLETGVPADDCAVTSPVRPYGSISSILALMMLNAVIADAVGRLVGSAQQFAVLESVHAPGGREHNERIVAGLSSRVPCWKSIPCVKP